MFDRKKLFIVETLPRTTWGDAWGERVVGAVQQVRHRDGDYQDWQVRNTLSCFVASQYFMIPVNDWHRKIKTAIARWCRWKRAKSFANMKFSRLAAARLNYLCGVGLWRCNLSGSRDSIHCTFEAGSIIHRWKKFIRGWSGQRGGGTIKCIGGELFPIVLNAAVGCNHLNMNETVTVLPPNFVRRLAEATVVTVEQLSEEKLQQNHPLADMSLCGERPPPGLHLHV